MSNTIFKATPRVAREYALDALMSGCVPFIKGSPGIGKSAIMRSISDEWNLKLIDHRVTTSQPEDFTGLPDFEESAVGGPKQATFRPFDIFPVQGVPLPKDKDGWLIFLDEFNSGEREVQAAGYKISLDKMVGQFPLHERALVAMAGNLATDKAIVNNLGTAMQSRLIHINMVVSLREWYEDVAIPCNYHEWIRGYLSWKGEGSLMRFNPDHDEDTFPCPRTWEFMDRLLKDPNGNPKEFKEILEPDPNNPGKNKTRFEMDGKIGLYSGTIGQSEAASFAQYCKTVKSIITLKDILADPQGARVPELAELKWAQIAHLQDKITDQNFGSVAVYIDRYDLAFKVLFYRTIMGTMPSLRTHPALVKSAVALGKYLYS